jgi:phosphoglucomutase
VSRNQGIRVIGADGSRVVYRLSGTAGSGATVRIYMEKFESDSNKITAAPSVALQSLVEFALSIGKIPEITGMASPTVIT